MLLLRKVVVGIVLDDPPCTVQVARMERVLVRLGDESRETREHDHEEDAEPEVSRTEEVVIVAVDGCREPSGSDDGVNGLSRWSAIARCPIQTETYRVRPDKHDTESHSEEDPGGPHMSVETIEKISRHHSRDGHDLQKTVLADLIL